MPAKARVERLIGCEESEDSMSMWITCDNCGQPKEVPAYEGDGVYSAHRCRGDSQATQNAAMTQRYERRSDHDRRFGRGDDFAGDAWRDRQNGIIRYVAVGHTPNA